MAQLVGSNSLGLGKLIDGKNQFVHIMYSANVDGSNMTSDIQADTKYIGIVTSNSETAPTNPSDYSWGRFVGTSGTSSYTWLRYSPNEDGSNMTANPTPETKYIGVAITADNNAPTDYTKYSWALIKGDDGRGISKTEVTYQKSTSGTVIPTGTWVTTIPTVNAGEYLWTRTLFTYTDNTTSSTYSVARSGVTGLGISRSDVDYQKSTSGTVAPTGAWTATIPTVAANEYLWTRTTLTYTNATTSVSYSVGKMGADGKDAQLLYLTASSQIQAFDKDDRPKTTQAITISAKLQNASGTATFVAIPYIGNVAQTAITLGGTGNDRTLLPSQWTNTQWTTIAVTATLGSLTDTISVIKVKDGATGPKGDIGNQGIPGEKGEDGRTPYTHWAYAWSADGKDRFTTTYPNENIFSPKNLVAQSFADVVSTKTGFKKTSTRNDTGWATGIMSNKEVLTLLKPNTKYSIYYEYKILTRDTQGVKYINDQMGTLLLYSGVSGYNNISLSSSGQGLIAEMKDKKVGDIVKRNATFTTPANFADANANYRILFYTMRGVDSNNTEVLKEAGEFLNIKISEGTALPYTPAPSEDFANAYPTYAGTYIDYESTDSEDPTKYTWQRILGESGQDGKDGQTISLESGYAWSSDGKERFTPNYPNDNLMKNTLKPSIGNTPPSSIIAPVDSSTLPCPVGYSATFSGGRIDIFETSHVRYTTVASQSGASEKYYRFCTPGATNIANKLVPFEAGKTYEISMDIKASLGGAILNWRGQWHNGSGWDSMDGWHAERVYGNETHYSRISKTFTIPDGAKSVYLSLQLYGADGAPNTVPNGAWFQFTNLKVSEGGKDASYPYTVSSTEDEQNVYPTYRGERQQPKPINQNQVQGTLFKTPWAQTWNSAGGTVETTADGIKLTATADGQTGIGAPLWDDIPQREGLYVQFEARGTARAEVYALAKYSTNTVMSFVALEEKNWRKCGFYFENPMSYSNILNFSVLIRGTGAWIEIKKGTLKVERMGEPINQGKPNMFSWDLWRSSNKETIVSIPVIKIQGKPNTWYSAESNIPAKVGATNANPYFDAFVYNSSETAPNSNTNGLGATYNKAIKTNDDGIINLGLRGGDTESLGQWVAIREQKAPSEWSLEPHEVDNAPSYKWTRWSGKDGASIKSTKTEWAINTSSVDEPTSGWSTTIPTLQKGKYLWTRTTWEYTDGTISVAYTVNYIPVDGSTGNGVKSIAVTYAVGTSGTTQPSTGWQATPPNVTGGQYLWTRIIWTFTDNTNQTTYSVARFGQDGISVTGTQSEYVQTTSSVEPTSGWSATRPTPQIGMWLWVRTRNTLSNGTYTNWVVTSSYTGRDSIFISATAPSNPTTGTLWQKPNDPTVLKWNGTAWENWGMSINNIVADNVIAENGMFKKVTGVEIVGSTIRNPYNVKYSDNSTGSGEIVLEKSQIKNNIKQYSSTGVFKNAHSQIMAANYILMGTTNEAGNTNYNQLFLDPDVLSLQTFSSNPNSGGNGYGAEYSSTGLRLTDSRVSLGNSKLEIHDLIKVETTMLNPASGWQRYSEVMGYTNTPTATRVGRTVQLAGAFKPINQLSAGQYIINQPLPVWARPLNNITVIQQGSGVNRILLEVRKDGAILVSRYGTTADSAIPSGAWINISCVFAGQDLF